MKVNFEETLLDIFTQLVNHHDACIVWKTEESFRESARCRSCTETLELTIETELEILVASKRVVSA